MEIQITDQGREYDNSISEHLHSLTGVKHRISKAYHPQTNGLTERFNRTLQEAVVKQVVTDQKDWDELLDGILFAYRTNVHESTNCTPFSIMYGIEARLPVEMEQTVHTDTEADNHMNLEDKIAKMQEVRKSIHQKASNNIKTSQARQKKYFDFRHNPEVCYYLH